MRVLAEDLRVGDRYCHAWLYHSDLGVTLPVRFATVLSVEELSGVRCVTLRPDYGGPLRRVWFPRGLPAVVEIEERC